MAKVRQMLSTKINKLIIIWLLHHSTTAATKSTLLINTNDNDTYNCVNIFSKILYNNQRTLVVHNSNSVIKNLYKSQADIDLYSDVSVLQGVRNLGMFNLYFLLIRTLQELRTFFELFHSVERLNFDAKFVLHVEGNIDLRKIFQISWVYKIVNLITIQNTTVYTYFPYEDNKCGKNISERYLGDCESVKLNKLFEDKIPWNLKGCQVLSAVITIPPFVNDINSFEYNPAKPGLEVTIVHNIAKWMNFSENRKVNSYFDWRKNQYLQTYLPVLKKLENKKIDIMYGYCTFFLLSYTRADLTNSHISDFTTFWVPSASKIPKWKNLLKIFRNNLWLLLFSVALLKGLTWWILLVISRKKKDLGSNLLVSWAILLQQTTKFPKYEYIRISFSIWSIVSLVIFAAFNSKLMVFHTHPLYEHQMKTINELADSELGIGVKGSSMGSIRDERKINEKLFPRQFLCNDLFECLNQAVINRNVSIFMSQRVMEYLIPKYYTKRERHEDDEELLSEIQGFKYTNHISIYTVRMFPLLKRINLLIKKFQENGLIMKWDRLQKESDNIYRRKSRKVRLSLFHLQTPFYFLLFGLFVSLIVFLGELFIAYKKRNLNRIILA